MNTGTQKKENMYLARSDERKVKRIKM